MLNKDDKLIIFDDVLATGDTAEAAYKLLQQEADTNCLHQQNVCFAFLLEIDFLKGREYLTKQTGIPDKNIISLIRV